MLRPNTLPPRDSVKLSVTTPCSRRDSAPLSARVWKEVDDAVGQAARHVLAGRRIATFDGPHGWDQLVASRLGTMVPCQTREGKATVCRRSTQTSRPQG